MFGQVHDLNFYNDIGDAMKRLVVIVVGAALLAAGWFFGSPLFIDETVDEDFDFVLEGGGVDLEAVTSMPL